MQRWDIITELIKKNNYKNYLEIGYYKGWSFDNIIYRNEWINMTAVDPNPCKNEEQQKMNYGEACEYERDYMDGATRWLSKSTSDDFFKELDRSKKWLEENTEHKDIRSYDIIFIDGLHESEQVYKDIMNSLKYLSPGGTIVLHDCNPSLYEHTTTGIDGCWTGDTYKAFVKFRLQYPEYESFTVDTDWGCGVIRDKLLRDWTVDTPTEEILPILEWDYFNVNRRYLLGLISVEEFKTKLNEGITNHNLPAK